MLSQEVCVSVSHAWSTGPWTMRKESAGVFAFSEDPTGVRVGISGQRLEVVGAAGCEGGENLKSFCRWGRRTGEGRS